MNRTHVFAIMFFVFMISSVSIVAYTVVTKGRLDELMPAPANSSLEAGLYNGAPSAIAEEKPVEATASQLEALLSQTPKVAAIPWMVSEITEQFERASLRACQLLPMSVAVVQSNETPPEAQIPGTFTGNRVTAFTVGLRMDPNASLPTLTKHTIENYLGQHLLAVQPIVYANTQGLTRFGGDLVAAFVDRSFPQTTTNAETMIAESIHGFRVLGAYVEPTAEPDAPSRTLILAFGYMRDVQSLVGGEARQEFELLFLHLLPHPDGAKPQMVVFSTAEGRTKFEELDLSANDMSPGSSPVIEALIRFKGFSNMVGLNVYPKDPVVTNVRTRSLTSFPLVQVRQRIMGDADHPATPLSQFLDEMHAHPGATDPLALSN